MRLRVALLAPIALAACFERGGGRPAKRDAGVVATVTADAAADDGGWLVGEPGGVADPAATVRIALEAEPVSLDPFAAGDATARRVLADVYEGLLCPDATGAPAACLAARWEVSADRTTWRFWLRPGVRFHDGGEVTAADVIASVRAPGQGASARGPLAAVVDDLVAADSPAPGEVVLRFAAARVGRARDLTMIPIAPAARIAAGDLDRAPVGTGPLRVVTWRRGEAIALARWDGYRGPPAAAAAVRYRVTADRAEALRLIAAGELDVAVQVPIDQARAFTADHAGAVRFRYEMPAFLAAVYNTRRAALAAPATRRALTALLDRPGLATEMLGGARRLSGPWPPGDPYADPAVAPVPFDRALAARLLGAARPAVELLVPQGSTTTARIADVWAADARDLARLTVRAVPYPDFLARLAGGDFDVAITSLSAGPEVDWWSRFASAAPPADAWPGLADAALDDLLSGFRTVDDPARRAGLARAIHRRLDELQPLAFIAVDTRAGVAGAGVGGLVGAVDGPPRARAIWKAR